MYKKKFYIKERHNPQLGVYYVAEGQLSKTRAKEMNAGKSAYGSSHLNEFETETEYLAEIEKLKQAGFRVHNT